jgi:hypothetical protein
MLSYRKTYKNEYWSIDHHFLVSSSDRSNLNKPTHLKYHCLGIQDLGEIHISLLHVGIRKTPPQQEEDFALVM